MNKLLLQDALSLLPKDTPKKLVLLVLLQVSISLLDIFAVLLLGTTAKLSLDYVQNKEVNFPETLMRFVGIENRNFEEQLGIVFILIVILFCARTVFSIKSQRKIYLYLGNQAGLASKRILDEFFLSNPQTIISKNSQEYLHGVTAGIDSLTLQFLGALTILITEIFFVVAMLCVVILVQPITGLIAVLIFASSLFGISKATSNKARMYSSEISKATIFYNTRLLETLFLYRELLLRRKEIEITPEIMNIRSKSLVLRALQMSLPSTSKYLFELTLVLGGALTATIQLFVSDPLTAISSVAIFLTAASRILPSLIRGQAAFISLRNSEGNSQITVKEIRRLKERKSFITAAKEDLAESTKFVPTLKVTNLSFTYADQSSFALEDINFEVSAGQFVAIVGESGAGKTTLIDLMLGLLTPNSGKIETSSLLPLDAIRQWPGKISYVPQDILVIDESIKRNVALEEAKHISDEEVLIALEKSHLLEDVQNMKNGLNEIVGERGIRLSGGQRQRLGIARALYTKPEMIIFDEATSSLDPLTEKTVTEAIYEKKGNVTLIVVAHRLSTVKNADLVILMDKGRILAKGTFEEVRGISPKFDQQARLVNL